MLNEPEPPARTFVDPVSDSSRWSAFVPREDDIVVCTPPKSGTTWTQGIVALLISGDPDVDAQTSRKAQWIDVLPTDMTEIMAALAAQTHRRQVKTHSPLDCIPLWRELRYITVYRHPIDVHFSSRKHYANMKEDVGLTPIPEDISEGFRFFLNNHEDHMGLPLILDHFLKTWERMHHENVLRLHYADMCADLPNTFDRIATHLGITHPPDLMAKLVDAATFANMKANAHRFAPSAGRDVWKDEASFFDSASSNKWEGLLSDADLAAYDQKVNAVLSPEQRAWLEWGGGGQ